MSNSDDCVRMIFDTDQQRPDPNINISQIEDRNIQFTPDRWDDIPLLYKIRD